MIITNDFNNFTDHTGRFDYNIGEQFNYQSSTVDSGRIFNSHVKPHTNPK